MTGTNWAYRTTATLTSRGWPRSAGAGAARGLGFSVVTYDYRGTGRSRPASLRGFRVSMADWINHDVAAVTQWAAAQFPDLALLAVGHSVGGHAIALSRDSDALSAAVLVASHAGVTRTIRGRAERARVWLLARVLRRCCARSSATCPAAASAWAKTCRAT